MLIILFCTLIKTLSAYSIDLILPAFEILAGALSASKLEIQSTVSLYLVFLGLGQFLLGTLSDSWGRKSILRFCCLCFILGTLLCLASEHFPLFLTGRILQGFGASMGQALVQAILRDLYRGEELAKAFALNNIFFGVSLFLGPLLSLGLLRLDSWQALFFFLLVLGLILMGLNEVAFQETLPPERRTKLRLRRVGRGVKAIFSHYQARFFLISNLFPFLMLVLILTNLPYLYLEHFGLDKTHFALLLSGLALAIVLGQLFNRYLIHRFNSLVPLLIASRLLLLFPLLALSCYFLNWLNWKVFSCLLVLFDFSFSIQFSNGNSFIFSSHHRIAGLCSSVVGFSNEAVTGTLITLFLNQYIAGELLKFLWVFLIVALLNVLFLSRLNRKRIMLRKTLAEEIITTPPAL